MTRIALCNEVLREFDFAEQCRIIADLGFDAIEIAPFTLSGDPAHLSLERRREVRAMAEDAGLSVAGLHWLMNAPEGLSITDPTRADVAGAHMEAMVQLCADLGGEVLVHGSPMARDPRMRRMPRGRAQPRCRALRGRGMLRIAQGSNIALSRCHPRSLRS
ncbi:MAG: TIM barrel protein [Roseicyclus sp.]|nr:TIM barrel protein [Roseicyclus sp.]